MMQILNWSSAFKDFASRQRDFSSISRIDLVVLCVQIVN